MNFNVVLSPSTRGLGGGHLLKLDFLTYTLNTRFGKIPAMGKFFTPQHGFWQQAEPYDQDYNQTLKIPGLKGEVNVYFDERLVPHIYADNQEDAVFVQGYLHATISLMANGISDTCRCRTRK